VTRADLFAALEILFDPVPVVSAPLDAVIAPAVILGGANRTFLNGYWHAEYELIFLVGPLDETDLWDRCDALQNSACTQLVKLPNVTDFVQQAPPAPRAVGNVDVLSFLFTFTDHNVVGPCAV
jgi:hypothetical protein